MASLFGKPKAKNKWFGNQMIIPEAGYASPSPLLNPTQNLYPGYGNTAFPPPGAGVEPLTPEEQDRLRREQEARDAEQRRNPEGGYDGDAYGHSDSSGTGGGTLPDWAGTLGKYAVSGVLGGIPGFIGQGVKDIYGTLTSDNDPVAAATAANKEAKLDPADLGPYGQPGINSSVADYLGEAVMSRSAGMSAQEAFDNAFSDMYSDPPDVALAPDYSDQFSPGATGHGSHAGAYGDTGPTAADGTIGGSPAAGTAAALGLAAEQQASLGNTGYGMGSPAHASIGTNLSDAEQAQAAADAGGSGAGPGTVICTALHYHGMLPHEVFQADQAYGRKLLETDPAVLAGYHRWATPIARLMIKSKTVTAIVAPLAIPWAQHLYGNKNALGAFYMAVGVPICRWIGRSREKRGITA
jgi:hypothetical protein